MGGVVSIVEASVIGGRAWQARPTPQLQPAAYRLTHFHFDTAQHPSDAELDLNSLASAVDPSESQALSKVDFTPAMAAVFKHLRQANRIVQDSTMSARHIARA